MSCDKGYKGDCCCKCKHQLKIHVCDCGKCATVKGWICKIFYEMAESSGKSHRHKVVTYMDRKHGCCEMFEKRTA